ncbi:undecaprenyl phosphate-alpha-4-amino-4-deoxy-L-arabinose arabinosyl transferase [Clostridium puniceum]|uniref:Undecaprenyl phosphate-alpha-4-amino-4-deoxy-L-arabinose arabinosyl transferase n=1 Tax=Clostridium puniceum TaxID=29367 RepID=A0A1S8TA16_9CLOT|nr:glycosyltransferase family 39 protein [Clostridium puniceum]OOM74265.1 undecaprenyl phosphate-alpha-4-amino-4-deoxy-L-arabinose arabinosyl transferase [Clostridium puniceum]
MKKLKFTKETLGLSLILILSSMLNFSNIGINGYGNGYYAAGVKSMTMNLKNFFFVSFDSAGFVTVDKPPMGFWIQAIFAKIFGFSGWSILLPQAIAGVISVYLLYYLVKKSFGTVAGFISALCLSVTPVFVAASRNNTIDNLLVATLLFACVTLTKAAEKGKAKYLYISLLFVGIGFNIKMLEAYMIGPALYITYLLAHNISFKKKIGQLVIGTIVLFSVSLSWAVIVDLVPAKNRPYVGSSTNNSEIELIIGHNGLKRLGLSNDSNGGFGGGPNREDGNMQSQNSKRNGEEKLNNNQQVPNDSQSENNQDGMPDGASNANGQEAPEMIPSGNSQGNGHSQGMQGNMQAENNQGMPGTPPDGNNQDGGNMQLPNGNSQGDRNMQPASGGSGGKGGVQGSFGAEVKAGITRLFAKSSLSDQIVWFLPLALLGVIAVAIKEKLRFKLDNKRKISLVLWITWLVPEFIYFSFTTGLFHPYYLTMMAPPAAALAGIGITTMWELYKEGRWKGWLLPIAFVVTGLTHMMMLSYFTSNLPTVIRNIILLSLILCFVASAILAILNLLTLIKEKNNSDINNNKNMNFKKVLVGIATVGILVTPFIGASAAITRSVNSTIPCAGLELLSNETKTPVGMSFGRENNLESSKLINFLKSNKTNEKYLLVVFSSQSADNIIIQTGEAVMALGGFSGSDKIITLDKFKELVKNGEVRYVLSGGRGPEGNNEIMNWIAENGTAVPESEYKNTTSNNEENNQSINNDKNISNPNNGEEDARNTQNQNKNNSQNQNSGGFRDGNNSEQLYDLKDVASTLK